MAPGTQNGSLGAPPAPFRQTSPQVLELREGGGRLALFGWPFFLCGLVMELSAAGVLHIAVEDGGNSRLGLAFVGLAFTVFGAWLAFGRRWTTFDLARGRVARRYEMLVPLQSREWLLSDFNTVAILYQAGDSDSGPQYPVRLRSINGRDLTVTSSTSFAESRGQAEYLSVFLRLPLVDTTSDHDTVVAPAQAGQSLRERLLSGKAEAQPLRPEKMRCQVTESPGRTTIVIPGGGSWPAGVLSIVFPLVMLLFVIPAFLRFFTRGAPPLVQYGFLFFLVCIFVVPSLFASVNLMVGSARKKATVTASAAGLEIVKRSGGRTRTTQIPNAELLDLDCSTVDSALKSAMNSSVKPAEVPSSGATRVVRFAKRWVPAQGIIVKSRRELIRFGEGLSGSELQYLRWILRKALLGR
ncbi:MAG TPA: hypothetical protein VMT38_03310 [Terracidiphilus sp.]|nr:hypothetical protein [Terracidiphilus sp.]